MSSKLRVNEIHPYQGNDIQVSGSLRISGSGPSKISLEVFGDITASGVITGKEFIVESITSSRIFAEGSSQFGNTLDDKHSFSGSISSPITASHDVSSSSGTGSFQHVYVAEDLDVDGTTSLTNLEVVHITASGDISASSQTATHILGGDNVTFDLQGNQIFKLSGNLTASGDISSSTGDVYAKDFYIGNDQFTDETTVDNHFAIGASGDSGILLTNITASGDISSSGTIIANNFRSSAGGDTEPDLGGINFNDHMILHGQLTASQNISQSEGFTGSFGSIRVPAGTVGNDGHIQFDDSNQFIIGSGAGDGFMTIQTKNTGATNMSTGRFLVTADESITLEGSAITASHAISASSTIAEHSIGGKSIILGTGDTGDITTLDFKGNITASNHIDAGGHGIFGAEGVFGSFVSASSHISASGNIFLAGAGANNNFFISTDTADVVNIGSTNSSGQRLGRIQINNDMNSVLVNASITASNITASGVIIAEGLEISDDASITDDLSVGGTLSVAQTIEHIGDTDTNIKFATDKMTFKVGNETLLVLDEDAVDIVTIGTDTIISGNVSASGNISASNLDILDTIAFRGPGTAFGSASIDNLTSELLTVKARDGLMVSAPDQGLAGFAALYLSSSDDSVAASQGFGQIQFGNLAATGSTAEIIARSTEVHDLDSRGTRLDFAVTAKGNNEPANVLVIDGNNGIEIIGDVTASGDISASGGTITAASYDIGTGTAITELGDHIAYGNSTTDTTILGAEIELGNTLAPANVTASNNISASGTIFAHSGSFEHSSGITGSFGRIEGKAGNAYININDPDETNPGFAFLTSNLDRLQLGTNTVFNESQHIDNNFLVKTSGGGGTSFRIDSETSIVAIGIPATTVEASASLTVRGHISASGLVVAQGFVPKFKGSNVAAAGSDQSDATQFAVNLANATNVFVEGADAAKGVQLPSIRTIGLAYSSSLGSDGNIPGPGEGWNGQDGGNPTGLTYMIVNTSDEALKVYPETSQQILPLSANAPVVIPGYNKCEFLLSGSGEEGAWWPFFSSGSTSNAV
jgi:hypothetical protein